MMELTTCVFVVTLVSLVTATPYGYGVKGGAGASAKADSVALAGPFGDRGDIPPVIPAGNGYSGSFSQSSSSSSASSSSSSSSSSFTYSGSGAAGFSNQGANGNLGCATGACHGSGANDISANHEANGAGAGLHGYNAANAAAAVGSGSNCNGAACDNSANKCSSGQCQSKPQTGALPSSYDVSNKCSSGQCGSKSPSVPSTYDDSDDIQFVAYSSKSHDSKDQSSGPDKAGSDCRGENCRPSTPLNSQPHYGHGPTNSYQNTKPSTNLNFGSTPSYHLPAIELETPKLDSNCNSGNCNDQSKPVHDISPSSYNNHSPTQKPTCQDGKCDSPQKGYSSTGSISSPTNYLSPQSGKGPHDYPSSTHCAGSQCGSAPSSQVPGSTFGSSGPGHPNCDTSNPNCKPHYTTGSPTGSYGQPAQINPSGSPDKDNHDKLPVYTGGFGAPTGVLKPNEYDIPVTRPTSPGHAHPSTPTQSQPTFGSTPTGCNSPGCYNQNSSPGLNTQPTPFGSHTPTGEIGQKLPSYSGGFGGPPGMLKPNDYNIPAPVTSKPIHSSTPTYNAPSPNVSGCSTPNCIGSSPSAGVTSAASAQSGSYGIHNQQSGSVTVTNDKSPIYTGGFGGPAGMLKPNDFDIQVTNKPAHPTNPTYNNQSPSSPALGCKSPNCNTFISGSGASAGAHAQSGSYGATKPSTGVDSSSELPPYTGGFGGPAGVLKPNEFGVPHNPNYPGVSPSKSPATNNLPGCTTPNCSPSSVGPHPQASFGVTKPSSVPYQPSVTAPGYTSNYNKPVGVTYPSAPAVAPISPGYSHTQPLHPTGIYTGCTTGNCAASPTGAVPSDVHGPTGSYGVSAPNANSKPQYTGDFGGPSGTISPTDHSNVPSTGSDLHNCKTGNCANVPSSNSGATTSFGSNVGPSQGLPGYTSGFGAPSDTSNPTGSDHNKPLTGLSTPGACSSGNCNSKTPSSSSIGYSAASAGAHASASSAASANAVAYTGGFGGPPGFLKPYDNGKVDLTKIAGGSHYTSGSPHDTKPGTFTSGGPFDASGSGHLGTQSNIGALTGSAAGATAYAGSLASTSGSDGYNLHGTNQAAHGVKGSSPCGGGCGGGHQGGLYGSGGSAVAAARSLSSSGAYGTAGSFASSSASAHSSAGAYTKGGYGKR